QRRRASHPAVAPARVVADAHAQGLLRRLAARPRGARARGRGRRPHHPRRPDLAPRGAGDGDRRRQPPPCDVPAADGRAGEAQAREQPDAVLLPLEAPRRVLRGTIMRRSIFLTLAILWTSSAGAREEELLGEQTWRKKGVCVARMKAATVEIGRR